jgi:hypothetical protein
MGSADNIGAGAPQQGSPSPNPPLLTLTDDDMPALFKAADSASIKARKTFFFWLVVELVMLALSALVAIFAIYNLPEFSFGPITIPGLPDPVASAIASVHKLTIIGIISGALGAIALGARLYRTYKHSDTVWYESRAAAESVKSLAWRYTTGGRPFPLGGDEVAVRKLLFQRLDDTLTDVAHDLKNRVFTDEQKITPKMQALRQLSLPERQKAYSTSRIQDQEQWYLRKSKLAQASARMWHNWLVVIEIAGVAGSILLALRLIPFNLQGVIGALAGAVISWTQSQRYQDLAASYRITGSELGSIRQGISRQTTEDGWSTFVDESEEACSREHRLWRATRDKDPHEG